MELIFENININNTTHISVLEMIRNDDIIPKYLEIFNLYSLEETVNCLCEYEDFTQNAYLVKDNDEYVGYLSISFGNHYDISDVELRYAILSNFRGNGLAKKMIRQFIIDRKLENVWLTIRDDNLISKNIADELDFKSVPKVSDKYTDYYLDMAYENIKRANKR